MLDIPGFRQFARFQPGSLQKTSHSSVKYQYFIVPIFPYTHVSFLSVFVSYLFISPVQAVFV